MPTPTPPIVGRRAEVRRFERALATDSPMRIVNVHGPGGIGKTVVVEAMHRRAVKRGHAAALVDGAMPGMTGERLLRQAADRLGQVSDKAETALETFTKQHNEYLTVQNVLDRAGSLDAFYEAAGDLKDPTGLSGLFAGIGQSAADAAMARMRNRFALEQYLRGEPVSLVEHFAEGIDAIASHTSRSVALLVDTFEAIEHLDDWFLRLVETLPDRARVVISGRNALAKVNFEWGAFGERLDAFELEELAPEEAGLLLQRHGLTDEAQRDAILAFTGGYPLLLVLVTQLARDAGGWAAVGRLEAGGDRDRVAGQLLERILREEGVREVREFLEWGVVARWFDVGVVGAILELEPRRAREVYDRLQRYSFVTRHPHGLQFHDKIREILLERLRFQHEAHAEATRRLDAFYAAMSGDGS